MKFIFAHSSYWIGGGPTRQKYKFGLCLLLLRNIVKEMTFQIPEDLVEGKTICKTKNIDWLCVGD